MALPRDHRLEKGSVDVGALPLTPQEFFVFSRVEGTPTVRELLAISGIEAVEAERIVGRLLELGALRVRESAPVGGSKDPERPASPLLRDKARERRLRMLQAQLGPKPAPVRPPSPEAAPDPSPVARKAPPGATEEEALERVPAEMAPVDDPRLDPSLAITLEDQRFVLGTLDRIDALTPFALLGIAPTHDTKAVRRAYHEMSRRLHPDTYYGRNLGPFRELLSYLFHRAKIAQEQLRDAAVREPLVDAHLEGKAREQRAREEERLAHEAAEEARRRRAEGEARARRQTRAAERLQAERERFEAAKHAEADAHIAEARAAEKAGALGKAANLYRMALQCRPDDVETERAWQACLARARSERAADAFTRALASMEIGRHGEASKWFVEAAEAVPTAEHLAHAADAMRTRDPVKARAFAMAALEALGASPPADTGKAAQRGALHLMVARAFLAAGQRESAREQALVALRLRPHDKQIRALLNSIKVT